MLLKNNNEINLLTNKIKGFKILSQSFRIHYTYRDRRKAIEHHKECVFVSNARLELNQI